MQVTCLDVIGQSKLGRRRQGCGKEGGADIMEKTIKWGIRGGVYVKWKRGKMRGREQEIKTGLSSAP